MDRVERRDCSAARQRHSALLRRAPVELGEQVSLHPALRVDTVAVGKLCPLRAGWWPAYTGGIARRDDASETVLRH